MSEKIKLDVKTLVNLKVPDYYAKLFYIDASLIVT